MTREEFRHQLEGFFAWAADRDRKETSWWLAVGEYADGEFRRAYRKEKVDENRSDAN